MLRLLLAVVERTDLQTCNQTMFRSGVMRSESGLRLFLERMLKLLCSHCIVYKACKACGMPHRDDSDSSISCQALCKVDVGLLPAVKRERPASSSFC